MCLFDAPMGRAKTFSPTFSHSSESLHKIVAAGIRGNSIGVFSGWVVFSTGFVKFLLSCARPSRRESAEFDQMR